MNEVFVAALNRSQPDILADVPRALLDPAEETVLDWIWDYRKKYAQLPTADRVDREFPFFTSYLFTSADPTQDLFDQFVRQRQESRLSSKLVELSDLVRAGKILYPSALTDLLKYTTKVESGIVRLGDFSLDWFKREGPSLPFGIKLFDNATGGMRDADYTLIVGRPGVGKSLIGAWLAHRWWDDNRRIMIVSKEMKYQDMLGRVMAMIGEFNPKFLRRPEAIPPDVLARLKVAQHMAKSKARGSIEMPKKPVKTPEDLMAILDTHEYDAVIIDGLYLLNSKQKSNAKWERISDISNDLKQVANDTSTPILGITQLKRGTDKKGLDLEDIAYSDSLGQDADMVIALADAEEDGSIEARLTKNRHGESGSHGVTLGCFLTVDWDGMKITEGLPAI